MKMDEATSVPSLPESQLDRCSCNQRACCVENKDQAVPEAVAQIAAMTMIHHHATQATVDLQLTCRFRDVWKVH